MRKTFLSIFIILVSIVPISCGACSSRQQFPSYTLNSILPRESFVKIEVTVKITECPKVHEGECIQDLGKAHASGAVVKRTPKGSYILTADHVCDTDDQIPLFLVLQNYKVKGVFDAIDIDERKIEAVVHAQSDKIDACILFAKDLTDRKAIPLKGRSPDITDTAYNIAAPGGFFGRNMVPIFEGRYSGMYNEHDIYTIPAMGGSSGSPIIDVDGNLIGMIFAVHRNFPFISFSPTTEDLYDFLRVLKKTPR